MSIIEDIRQAVIDGDGEKVKDLIKEALKEGTDPLTIVEEGLTKGLNRVGKLFEEGQKFLAELVIGGEIMKEALEIIMPELLKTGKELKSVGRVVIGTVAGDIHSIGKNMVSALLTANGFEVIDIGEDVSTQKFIDSVKEKKPDFLGLSALLTVTHPNQKVVVEALQKTGLREKVKVVIGGRLVSEEWAEEIGADAFATNANEAIEKMLKLVDT